MKRIPAQLTIPLLVVALAGVALLLASCSDVTSTAPEQTQATADKAGSGDGDPTTEFLDEYRPCDGSTSIYTVQGDRTVGLGSGATLHDAMGAAIDDAIATDVEGQFECQLCPDEEACEKFVTDIDRGGAYVEDPEDCEWLQDDDGNWAWHCMAWVNFNSGNGPPASGKGGCKLCPALAHEIIRIHWE
ncbi:hypothetical protein KKG45_10670 [bacterium]|nr:hypothetical protein [bacterium]MBU1073699.1 hypothetical protein [bacterium]MBU1675295.1 hypothetical protein [bacterium]